MGLTSMQDNVNSCAWCLLISRHCLRAYCISDLRRYSSRAQSPATGKVEFEVASVKPSKSDNLPPNSTFPLGPGSAYVSNGGHFSAVKFPLATYIAFAYEVMGSEQESLISQLPRWGLTDHFDIDARTDGSPAKDTKDQMRLMMRSSACGPVQTSDSLRDPANPRIRADSVEGRKNRAAAATSSQRFVVLDSACSAAKPTHRSVPGSLRRSCADAPKRARS